MKSAMLKKKTTCWWGLELGLRNFIPRPVFLHNKGSETMLLLGYHLE